MTRKQVERAATPRRRGIALRALQTIAALTGLLAITGGDATAPSFEYERAYVLRKYFRPFWRWSNGGEFKGWRCLKTGRGFGSEASAIAHWRAIQ